MSGEKRRKPAKMKPYTDQWERMANSRARDFAPPIYPCADCGGPVIRAFRCERCGSCNPEGL